MIVADTENSYTTGNGDVFDSADGIITMGSRPYALAAARALIDGDDMDAEAIAKRSFDVEICVYTNDNFIVETLEASDTEDSNSSN